MKSFQFFILGLGFAGLTACGIDKTGQGNRGETRSGAQFMVSKVSAGETPVSKVSSLGMPEEKLFNIQACVQDLLDQNAIIDREFLVWAEGDVQKVKTDSRGCLVWQERHSFNFVEAEAYFEIERRIEGTTAFKGTETLKLLINPWQSGGSALIDPRYDQVPEFVKGSSLSFKTKISRQAEKASALTIKQVSFHLRRYRPDLYRINKDLGLEIAHEYEFRTNIQLSRQTLDGGERQETPYKGRLRVHGYLTKQPVPVNGEIKEIIATFHDEVEIGKDGRINHPLIMTIQDPVAFTSRSYFYISVEPVDDPNIGRADLMGLDDPNGPFNVELRSTEHDIIELFGNKIKLVQVANTNPFKNFVDRSQLQTLSVEGNSALTKFATVLANSKAGSAIPLTGSELCEAVYPGVEEKANREACLCETGGMGRLKKWFSCAKEKQFRLEIRDVVTFVQGTPEILSGPVSESLSIRSTFEKAKKLSTDEGTKNYSNHGWKFSLKAGGGFDLGKLLDFSKLGVGAEASFGANLSYSFDSGWEAFKTDVLSNSTEVIENTSRSSEVRYEGESYRMGYKARIKRCALFGVVGGVEAENLNSRRLVCSEEFDRSVVQSYYLMNMKLNRDSVVTDSAAQDSNRHFMVRGRAAFETLGKVLGQKNIKLLYDRAEASDMIKPNRWTEEYPGLLLPNSDD